MCKKLAVISGKGGSGKTSFSLAFGKVLASLGLRVLLVDCDMSTHGSTFFMKPRIEKHKNNHHSLLSVEDILDSQNMPPYGFLASEKVATNAFSGEDLEIEKLLKINKNFFFLPSDISITNSKTNKNKYRYDIFNGLFIEEIESIFQFIIFDCQAGYCEFTRNIVKISDTCLLVTEPDSVSAAANKALCFQMGIEMQDVQAYQIFNKITEEEAFHYSKISVSTFFKNLPPVIFDWSVRRTFVYSKIPSHETVSTQFGIGLLDILSSIFPEYEEELNKQKEVLEDRQRIELKTEIRKLEMYERRTRVDRIMTTMLLTIPLILFTAVLMYTYAMGYSNHMLIFVTISTICVFLLESYLIMKNRLSKHKSKKEDLVKLKTQFENNKSTIKSKKE